MKKAMICQPMASVPTSKIAKVRNRAIEYLELQGYEVINKTLEDKWYDANKPLYFLADSLSTMARCNVVYFCKGWEEARGCRVEHLAALLYNREILYEV